MVSLVFLPILKEAVSALWVTRLPNRLIPVIPVVGMASIRVTWLVTLRLVVPCVLRIE